MVRAGLGPFDLFRLEKKPFPGPALPGLSPGVPAFELHLESQRLMELAPFEAVRHLRRSLRKVAEKVAEDPEVRLVYGYTYLADGGKILGLKALDLPFWPRLVAGLASAWFLWLYRGELPKRRRPPARMAHLSREELLALYPPSTPASPPPDRISG